MTINFPFILAIIKVSGINVRIVIQQQEVSQALVVLIAMNTTTQMTWQKNTMTSMVINL